MADGQEILDEMQFKEYYDRLSPEDKQLYSATGIWQIKTHNCPAERTRIDELEKNDKKHQADIDELRKRDKRLLATVSGLSAGGGVGLVEVIRNFGNIIRFLTGN